MNELRNSKNPRGKKLSQVRMGIGIKQVAVQWQRKEAANTFMKISVIRKFTHCQCNSKYVLLIFIRNYISKNISLVFVESAFCSLFSSLHPHIIRVYHRCFLLSPYHLINHCAVVCLFLIIIVSKNINYRFISKFQLKIHFPQVFLLFVM